MKAIDLKMILLLNTMKNLMKKILHSRLAIMSEYQTTKIFLLKDMLVIGAKKSLL